METFQIDLTRSFLLIDPIMSVIELFESSKDGDIEFVENLLWYTQIREARQINN